VGGVVYRQDIAYPAASFIPLTVITGAVAPAGTEGWFRLRGVVTTGGHQGNHCLELDVSYDDGNSWIPTVSAPEQLETGAGAAQYTVGETVSLAWYPRRRKGGRALIRIRMTALAAAASEGQTLTNIQLEIIRNKKARRAVKQA
jgi:hypothetical protein